ncbi:MAG: hypothetical protein ACREOS_09105, partial [Candidatus Dormibacteraceae bacterium]
MTARFDGTARARDPGENLGARSAGSSRRAQIRWRRDVLPSSTIHVVAAVVGLFFFFPYLWLVLTSLK